MSITGDLQGDIQSTSGQLDSLRPEELAELLQALSPQPSATFPGSSEPLMSNRVYDEATLLQAAALASAAAHLQHQGPTINMAELPHLLPALSAMSQVDASANYSHNR